LNSKYPEFAQKVEKLGVKYKKVAPKFDDATSALGRGWTSMYYV
jgi:hypothetical protein